MSEESKIDKFAAELRAQIKRGDFGPRGRIPSIEQLRQNWDTTRSTVSDILQLLQSEGLIRRVSNKRGSDLIVSFPALSLEGITESFERFLKTQGHVVTMENIIAPCIEEVPDEIAALLGESKGVSAVHRERLQGIQGLQLRIARNYYPVKLAGEFVEAMKANDRMDVVGAIKAKHGIFIAESEDVLEARIPTAEEVKLLDLVRTEPVVEIRRVNRAEDGTVVMVNVITHVAPYFKFTYRYEVDHWK